MKILLTGVTGKVGAATAKALAAQPEMKGRVRALARNPEKAANIAALGIEVVKGDLADPASLKAAFAGVEKAFLVMPNGEEQLTLEKGFVDAAKAAGVKHIVKLSSIEAHHGVTAKVPQMHVAAEDYIKASGLAWTMLKPTFYMQTLFANARTIVANGTIVVPCGEGKTGFTDTRDVGAVAAKVLSEPGHEGKSYDLTGPEILNFDQVAAKFGKALGKPITYVRQPMTAYREILGKFLPPWRADAVCELFTEDGVGGGLTKPTDTIQKLLGRAPTSLDQFINDHIAMYRGQ